MIETTGDTQHAVDVPRTGRIGRGLGACGVRAASVLFLGASAAVSAAAAGEPYQRTILVERQQRRVATDVACRFTVSPDPSRAKMDPPPFGGTGTYLLHVEPVSLGTSAATSGTVLAVRQWSWLDASSHAVDTSLQGEVLFTRGGSTRAEWIDVYRPTGWSASAQASRGNIVRQVLDTSLVDLAHAAAEFGVEDGPGPDTATFSVDSLQLDIGAAHVVRGQLRRGDDDVDVTIESGDFAPDWEGMLPGAEAPRPGPYLRIVGRGVVRRTAEQQVEARFDVRILDAGVECLRLQVDARSATLDDVDRAPARFTGGADPSGELSVGRAIALGEPDREDRVSVAVVRRASGTWVLPTLVLESAREVVGVSADGDVTRLSHVVGVHVWGHLTELAAGASSLPSRFAHERRASPRGAPVAVASPDAGGGSDASLSIVGPYADEVLGDFWCVVGDTRALSEGLPAFDASGLLVGLLVRIRATYDGARRDTVAVVRDPLRFVEFRGSLEALRTSVFGPGGPLALYGDERLRQASADARGDRVEAGLARLRALVATHPRSALALSALAYAEARAGDPTEAVESDRRAAAAYPCFRIPLLVEVRRARALVDAIGDDKRNAGTALATAEGVWNGIPSSQEATLTYAIACTRAERYLRAMRVLELVPLASTEACRARVELASVLEAREAPLDTEPLWRAAVAAADPCVGATSGLLSAFERKGKLAELIARLDATLEGWQAMEPELARVLRCSIRAGDVTEATRWLDAWATTKPSPAAYALEAGRVHALRGSLDAAGELLERAGSLGMDDSRILSAVIVELVNLRRFEVAERYLRRLGDLDPTQFRKLRREVDRRGANR